MDNVVELGPSCRHSPSDEWDNTSHSQMNGKYANHILLMTIIFAGKLLLADMGALSAAADAASRDAAMANRDKQEC
eukprot:6200628-Pleurochrysis_carterae.AAC.1